MRRAHALRSSARRRRLCAREHNIRQRAPPLPTHVQQPDGRGAAALPAPAPAQASAPSGTASAVEPRRPRDAPSRAAGGGRLPAGGGAAHQPLPQPRRADAQGPDGEEPEARREAGAARGVVRGGGRAGVLPAHVHASERRADDAARVPRSGRRVDLQAGRASAGQRHLPRQQAGAGGGVATRPRGALSRRLPAAARAPHRLASSPCARHARTRRSWRKSRATARATTWSRTWFSATSTTPTSLAARSSTCASMRSCSPSSRCASTSTGAHVTVAGAARLSTPSADASPPPLRLRSEGFARFTNARFSLNREDLSNTFVHLTNHAVQKKDKRVIPPAVRRRRTANTATAATAAARAARTTRPRRTLSGPFTA